MNILYGVSGEGYGHSSRALLIATHLEDKGHKVRIISYDRGYKILKEKFKVFKVKGPGLIFKKGILKKRKTTEFNIKTIPKNLRKWKKFHKLMCDFKPDICISDMDIFTPILSYWYDVPLLSIDNQHRLTNLKISIPKKYSRDFFIAKKIVNTFVKRADHYIITSFSNSLIIKRPTTIVPPIVREQVKKLKPKTGKKILVYLSSKNRTLIKTLSKSSEKFQVYGYNLKKKIGNIEFKTRETFLKDLSNCKCIIATAGFSLMSEAIYLNKPYLAIPLKGQFEQVLNCLFLKKASFGLYAEELKEEDLNKFLKNQKKYTLALKKYKPDYKKLVKTLDIILKNLTK